MCNHLTPLEIAQEAYINIFKAEYGIKPRNVEPEFWNDLEWLERQMEYMCAECIEHEEPKELGFFEELLANLQPQDYD